MAFKYGEAPDVDAYTLMKKVMDITKVDSAKVDALLEDFRKQCPWQAGLRFGGVYGSDIPEAIDDAIKFMTQYYLPNANERLQNMAHAGVGLGFVDLAAGLCTENQVSPTDPKSVSRTGTPIQQFRF